MSWGVYGCCVPRYGRNGLLKEQQVSNLSVLAFARVVKLLANVTKLVAYPFHYLLPNKRFTSPERAAPSRRRLRAVDPAGA